MKDWTTELVAEFHQAFGLATAPAPTTLPPDNARTIELLAELASRMEQLGELAHLMAKLYNSPLLLRLQLCQEELGELARAMADQDTVACLDALCDMRYVADGAALTLGLHDVFGPAFEVVHASNMTKLDDGRPIFDAAGRVQKPKAFVPPDLRAVLEGHHGS